MDALSLEWPVSYVPALQIFFAEEARGWQPIARRCLTEQDKREICAYWESNPKDRQQDIASKAPTQWETNVFWQMLHIGIFDCDRRYVKTSRHIIYYMKD